MAAPAAMPTQSPRSSRAFFRAAVHLLPLALFVAAALSWLNGDFRLPITYDGDGLWYIVMFRLIALGGWPSFNPWLGAPFGSNMADFPNADAGFHAVAWLLSRFTDDGAVLFNIFYLLGFPTSYAAAYWVLRRWSVGRGLAAAGGVAFALLPYHFWRVWHLFLATYFVIPLVVWACVRLLTEPAPPLRAWLRANKGSLAVAAAAGLCGVYYAFFACLLFAAAGALAALRGRMLRPALAGAALALLTGALVVAQLVPSLAYRAKYGVNTEVAARGPSHSQVLGLNLSFVLTPQDEHRIPLANELARGMRALSPWVNENQFAYATMIGVAGLLLLLARSLGAAAPSSRPATLDALAALNLGIILWATVAGFGFLFALLVTPEIRALNRISVFLGFIGIAAFLLHAQDALRRMSLPAIATGVAAVAVMALAWIDGVPRHFPPNRALLDAQYVEDRDFVARIEAAVPPGTRILTLPYLEFPERASSHHEAAYALMRPFVFSRNLSWSYGTMQGRAEDLWVRKLSSLPPPQLLETAARSGFGGIYIEGRAFADNGAALHKALAEVAPGGWMTSSTGEHYFLRLAPTGERPVDLDVLPALGAGFYGWEGEPGGDRWAWSRGKGVMTLLNVGTAREVKVTFGVNALKPRSVTYAFNGGPEARVAIDATRTEPVSLAVTLAPGLNTLRFASDLPGESPGTADRRLLSFAIRNVRIEPR